MRRFAVCLTCATVLVAGCPESADNNPAADKLVIFHNGTGPMSLAALAWLETVAADHPNLVIETHRMTTTAELTILQQLKLEYGRSQGISTTFGYVPLIFYRDQAFSGFDDGVRNLLLTLMDSPEP